MDDHQPCVAIMQLFRLTNLACRYSAEWEIYTSNLCHVFGPLSSAFGKWASEMVFVEFFWCERWKCLIGNLKRQILNFVV